MGGGDLSTPLAHLEKALALLRACEQTELDVDSFTLCRLRIGEVYGHLGRPTEAIAAVEAALVEKRSSYRVKIQACITASTQYTHEGFLEEGLAAVERAASMLASCKDDPILRLNVASCMGGVLRKIGRHEEALDSFRAAWMLNKQVNGEHSLSAAEPLSEMESCCMLLGDGIMLYAAWRPRRCVKAPPARSCNAEAGAG